VGVWPEETESMQTGVLEKMTQLERLNALRTVMDSPVDAATTELSLVVEDLVKKHPSYEQDPEPESISDDEPEDHANDWRME
jgi:hypothetical protein